MRPADNEGGPLRVVHVALQLSTGGMEKLLVESARHADRKRFELRFLSLTGWGPVADEIARLGWPVTALEMQPGLRPMAVLRLAKLFREWQADVVHLHNTKPLVYCAPAARLARVRRSIYTRHGQRYHASWRQNLMFRAAATMVNSVVCVSEDSARRAVQEGVRPAKVRTIWNGIDVSRFSYTGPTAGGPVVFVGRLSPEKNIETLLRAMSLAVEKEPGLRLEVAGGGECLPGLKQMAGELGLSECVRFLGNVDDVPGLLARASMSVLSSLTEGISLTLLEAMARGLPVVATRVGGNPEIVVDGETGWLVSPENPHGLAEAILSVWRDPGMGKKMGEAGRQRVEKYFDVRRMVAAYEALYAGEDESVASSAAVPHAIVP